MNCYVCHQETLRLLAPGYGNPEGLLYCEQCFSEKRPTGQPNYQLNQTVEKWTHRDKKSDKLVTHKLTKGKEWEIEHRRISLDDGKSVINTKTGKPAQY